jgi:hypothetical protein
MLMRRREAVGNYQLAISKPLNHGFARMIADKN